jgi:GAF domain-containing protein
VSTGSATPPQIASLQRRAARLREALAGAGAFLAAARRPDPLPALRDLAGDWLCAEEIAVEVPAGTGPLRSDEPCRIIGPVVIGRRTVGRIEATRRRPFDEDDQALIVALGQIIGGALEHATLQGQIEQYAGQARANADTLDRLLALGRAVVAGSPCPEALARQVAAQVPAMLDGERASVLLLPPDRPDQPVLVLSSGLAATPERAREVAEHGLAGMVLRERAPLIIDETDTDRRWLGLRLSQNDTRTRCAMAAPLLWAGKAIGALTVTTTHSRRFHTAHLNLLELAACHVALALRAASLDAQLARRGARLGALAADLDAALSAAAAGDPGALAAARGLAAQLRELAAAEVALAHRG